MAEETFEESVGAVLSGFMARIEEEFHAMSEEDLRARWYFKYDPDKSLRRTIYEFHDMLSLYSRSCRRWEEMHNGNRCVVERVRDKYLMPKIDELIKLIDDRPAPSKEGTTE